MSENSKQSAWPAIAKFIQEWGVLIAFVLIYGINMISAPDVFLSPANFRNAFSQNADIGIIALGMTLVIIGGGIDLSVGSMLAFAGAAALKIQEMHLAGAGNPSMEIWISLGVCLLCGILLGSLNGLLVTAGRLIPFIATLIGLLAFRSMGNVITQEGTINATVPGFDQVAIGGIPLNFIRNEHGVPLVIYWPIIILIAVSLILGFILNRTKFGRYLVAIGSNEKAARYSAVPVNKVKFLSYTLLGACVGIAALINASRLASVNSTTAGQLMELDAIAAVVIGGTSLAGGRGRIWGTFVGVLFITMVGQMLVANSVPGALHDFVKGAIILFAVLLQRPQKQV